MTRGRLRTRSRTETRSGIRVGVRKGLGRGVSDLGVRVKTNSIKLKRKIVNGSLLGTVEFRSEPCKNVSICRLLRFGVSV